MDNPLPMGVLQSVAYLVDDVDDLLHGETDSLLDQILQGIPFDILHGDISRLLIFPRIVNDDDIRMNKLPRSLDFLLKTRDEVFYIPRFGQSIFTDRLQGYDSIDLRIVPLVNNPHCPPTDFLNDFIST